MNKANAPITKYLWLDMEMSGLDVEACRILEVAAIIADIQGKEIDSFQSAIKQPEFILQAMDEWCTRTHGESGLTEKVRSAESEKEVERKFISFLDKHFPVEEKIILAGNSIGQDRKFIDYYWKKVAARLHYRMLDVSSFKVVFIPRYKLEYKKQGKHRALDDIRESMAELNFYLSHIKT